MGDMSLLLGTILSQLAVGTFITAFVIDKVLGKADEKKAPLATIVSFIAVFTHLGVPFSAMNALRNLGSSWLSREAVFFCLFMLLVLIYLLAQKGIIMKGNDGALKGIGCLACVAGIILTLVVPMIYMLPGVPAWNTAATPVSFVLSACLMGIPLGVYLTGCDGAKTPALLTGLLALCALLVAIVNVTSLQAGNEAQSASGYLMSGSGMFVFRLVLLAAGVLGGLYFGLKGAKKEGSDAQGAPGATIFLLLFCVLAAAEFIGRYLFFGTIVRM